MKHNLPITLLLLSMFLLAQVIGLFVVVHYENAALPAGLELPEEDTEPSFFELLFSFVIAFGLIFLLMKYKWKLVMKLWFFFVVALALIVSLNAIFANVAANALFILAFVLAGLKIFKPHVITHNVTELLIYPGIAAIFVQLLTPLTVIGLLILISLYDMWAVWKSGLMQEMARFQMQELNIFGGFLLPSASKKVKNQIKKIKMKYKNKKVPKSVKNKKFKVNLAILGGGDVVFPIIASGVFFAHFKSIVPALWIMAGSFVGLAYLFSRSQKDKAYPAMPYITIGIFLGIAAWKLFSL